MKYAKKFICGVLVAFLIIFTPLSNFVQIEQNVNRVEAASAIGGASVLKLILGAFGVTIATSALSNAVSDFTGWLELNGSEEAFETWSLANTQSLLKITAPLVVSVGSWITAKLGSLSSGSVAVSSNANLTIKGEHTALTKRANELMIKNNFVFKEKYYVISYANETWTALEKDDFSVRPYVTSVDNPYLVLIDDVYYFYNLVDGNLKRATFSTNCYYYDTSSDYIRSRAISNSGQSITGHTIESNIPVIAMPSGYLYYSSDPLDNYLANALYTLNLNVIDDAYTSVGGFDSSNIDSLDGLTVDSSTIDIIVNRVTDAINSNRTEAEDGSIVWSDVIAQAVSDAYAQGLADAKANSDSLEDKAEAEVTNGFLSSILNAIKALPALIFGSFEDRLVSLSSLVESIVTATSLSKDLITDIPSVIVGQFSEIFPTAQSITELITTLPANFVDALGEVFPKAEELGELISDVPVQVVDGLSVGIGALSDGIADVKEAVLAIPITIADSIALALENIFVPDFTLVEDEISNINDSLLWVPDLKNLVDDMLLDLEAGEPPVLYLDFTKADDDKYHGAGVVPAIDFSWYAKYKPQGDMVFGAFLWVVYIWYMFKRLPDIINGGGLITRESINFDNRMSRRNGGSE